MKDTFYRIAFAEGFVTKVHAMFEQTGMQPERTIDEAFGGVGGVFFRVLA